MKIHEAAKLLNVSLETLRRWEKAGKLIPQRTGGNQRTYTEEQIREFKSNRSSVISHQVPASVIPETQIPAFAGMTNGEAGRTKEAGMTTVVAPKHNPVTNFQADSLPSTLYPLPSLRSAFLPTQIPAFAGMTVRPFHLIFIGLAVGLLVFFGNKRLNTDVLSYRTDGDVLASLNIRQLPDLEEGSVLGFTTDQDISMRVNVPAIFGQPVIFEQNITAPNIVYSVVAGTGVTITGDPQNPVINADTESIVEDLDIFKTITVGSDSFVADGISDELTFEGSGSVTVSMDEDTKTLTFTGEEVDLSAAGGWTDGGTSVYLTTSTDFVGIGTDTPTTNLDILGTFNVSDAATFGDTVDITGALTLTGNALDTPGDLTLTITGGDLIFSDGTVINIGGSGSDVAFNVIGDSTSGASASVDSDNDLYVEGNLEVDGLIVGSLSGGVTTALDPGSVVFIGSSNELAADSLNFFWDDSTNRLGLGDNTPSYTLDVNGTANVTGDVIFGDADTDNITVSSEFLSSLIPNTNNTYDLGSNIKRWATVYGVTANFTNLSSGSTDISGTTSQDFTINTDNASVDTEDDTLTFDRGTAVVNTEIRWDSSPNYWLSTNAPTFFINGSTDITYSGKAALMVNQVQSQDLITASASGTTKFTVANNGSITTAGTTFTATSMTAFNCSDCIDFDDMEDTLDLDAALTLNQAANTWSQTFTGTTTNGYNYTADSLTTGTGVNYSFDGLTSGKGVYVESTSTAFTSGQLGYLYWNPGSATTATGDILRLDVGSNGIVGNILNVMNGGSSVFSVGQAQITAALPTQFTAAGDVNIAYDLIFSNQIASYIKSYAPLYIEAGESFENNDLTLRTFGTGSVVIDSMALNVMQAASVSGRLLLGTQINPDNLGQLYATNNITYGKALAIFNQTESQDIFTASSSGTTRFTIMNTGLTGVGTSTPSALLTVNSSTVATYGKAALIVDHDENQDLITASSSGLSRFIVRSSGDVVIGPTGTFDNAGSNEDLYVRGNLEVDGTIYGTVSATDVTCTDCMDFTELEDTLDLDAALTLNQTTNAWTQSYTGTTTGYSYTADSVATGNAVSYSFDGLSTGKGIYVESTSTAFSSGALEHIYWNPGSATTATGDILRLDVGSNGIVGNILNVMNGGSSVFSVGQAQITAALPTQFTAAGDVSIAYDLQFTNQTASYIKSLAPLIVEAGETFENNNLTLKTYGTGNVLIDSMALNVSQAASISGRLLVGTQTNPDNLGQMYVTNNIVYGKALAIFNQTESQDILTASSSGTTRFTIANDGRTSIGNALPVGMLNVDTTNTATFGKAAFIVNHDETQDLISASASGTAKFTVSSTGTITTVDNAWLGLGASAGNVEFDDQTVDEINFVNANVGIGTQTPLFRLDVTDTQAATVAAMITNSNTGTNADGLAIKLGFTGVGTAPTGDPPVGNRFVVFMNGGGDIHGAIDSTGASGVAFKTSGSDFAEYFKKADPSESLPVGAAVCLTKRGVGGVTACTNETNQSIVGVVSLYAGFVGGFDHAGDDAYALVGLVGQLPTLIDPASAPIVPGDQLSVGSVRGTVMKATSSGAVVGRALATWNPGQVAINVHVQQGYTSFGASEDLSTLLLPENNHTEPQTGDSIFDALATFMQNVIFRGIVSFEKAPVFARDTAGRAIITKYTDRVDVVFDEAYEAPPIVTMSLTDTATGSATATESAFLADGFSAVIKNVTSKGFSIVLPSTAIRDFHFNWIALAVKDVKETKSVSVIDELLNGQVAGVASGSGDLTATGSAQIATDSANASGSASVQ